MRCPAPQAAPAFVAALQRVPAPAGLGVHGSWRHVFCPVGENVV